MAPPLRGLTTGEGDRAPDLRGYWKSPQRDARQHREAAFGEEESYSGLPGGKPPADVLGHQ